MFVLVFYVPETHLEAVKNAVFQQGAGAAGDYSRCAWQVRGTGQFQPESGSTPYIGIAGKTETLSEYRVEIICPAEKVKDIAAAFLRAHPYEEPAYHFIPVLSAEEL